MVRIPEVHIADVDTAAIGDQTMRVFAIAADVIMGLMLGLFLYVVASRTWPGLQQPAVAAVVIAASVLVVLFRRPNGTFARGPGARSKS